MFSYSRERISPHSPFRASARPTSAGLAATAFALIAGAASSVHAADATPPEKFVLTYKAEVGQVKRVRGAATLTMTGPGKVEIKEVGKVKYTKVDAATGDITFEDTTESQEMTAGGQTNKDDKTETSTVTIHANGMLVAYKGPSTEEKDASVLTVRMREATNVVFPKDAVGVGAKWTQEYKGDTSLGSRDAKADFEIVGIAKVAGQDALKISMRYAENGSEAISAHGTFIIEKATGDELTSDINIEGIPFPGGMIATGVMHEDRIEGGPVAGSKNDVVKEEPKKEKTIDEIVKDGFEKVPGLVTLYRKKDSGRDVIYAELREDQLNKLMMLQATASTGTALQVVEGDPIDDLVFKFTRVNDDKVMITVPNFWYRASENTPLARSIRRSFADAFLQQFKIEAKQPERKTLLIDVSDFFKSDISQISAAFSPSMIPGLPGMGGGGYGMDREKTYIATLKNFPDNLVVSTQYNFAKGGGRSIFDSGSTLADPRSAPIVVTYNLFALPVDQNYRPTNGYQPRLADPRVGYFMTAFQSFDDDSKEDPNVYYIYRWDLKKKDPTAAVSEPVKPITFWMDNAIPTEYREAVSDGLLMWNKAFEKLGFKNAVVVKQMPDNPDPKDPNVPTDTADMRFNMIRWVTSPSSGYAVALFRTNPITGQILNASITVDAGIVHYTKLERESIIDPAMAFNAGAGVGIEEDLMKRQASIDAAEKAGIPVTPQERAARLGFDPRYCEVGHGLREQAWYGDMALSLLQPGGFSPLDKKEYTNQFVREVVAHEMGHIMGLRHNFIASTEFSLDQLKDPKITQAGGIGASVMDYNPFNISALKQKNVPYYSQTVGVYDLWAIQYGYVDVPGATTPDAELSALHKIASESSLPGHAWQSDEIADQFDPMVTRFDLSSDPVAFWQKNMDVCRYLLVNLDKRLPRPGESYWEFTRAFNRLVSFYARGAGVASRYVGGLNVNRNHKGDPGEKPTLLPVDVAKQRQALSLLNTYIFSPDALQFPSKYFMQMTTDPYGFSASQDFPIRDQIANLQRAALQRLFSGSVMARVANNEFKMGGDGKKSLTLGELFGSVSSNVWAEIDGHRNVPTLRRQLQRAYVDTMVNMVTKPGSAPEDARMLAWDQLRQLKARLEASQKTTAGYDQYTRVHLAETLAKVNRALTASITLGSNQAGGQSLLQMLMGG